jgi:mono/diheme cytochrome c family protein
MGRASGWTFKGLRGICIAAAAWLVAFPASAGESRRPSFSEQVQPILDQYCGACHGNGIRKGGMSVDGLADDESRLHDRSLWSAVLKNVRAGIMPPDGKPRLSRTDQGTLEAWIKYAAFGIDPANLDPGHVTVRRLNRIEYRNTIRDLMGVDYDTDDQFPPDDTGHGFDNIGDVLTLSPLLLEKYIAAARSIVTQAVPMTSRVVAEHKLPGRQFHPTDKQAGKMEPGPLSLSYYEPASVSTDYRAEHAGRYQSVLELNATERYVDGVFDYNKCQLIFKIDGKEQLKRDFSRQEGRAYRFEFDHDWQAGPHQFAIEVKPLTPGVNRVRSLALRIQSVTVRGPMDEQYWTRPTNYAKFFPRDVPPSPEARRRYARELLTQFATRAYRRPLDEPTVDRLGTIVETECSRGQTFEAGVARAMMVVLASPRFLFRVEGVEPGSQDHYPLIDEYALASRLSYFLWSSVPDDELFRLAGEHKLRANLSAQVKRMLADARSGEFFRNFVGQWLQTRDVDKVLINAAAILSRDEPRDPAADRRRARFRELNRKAPETLTAKEKEELKQVRSTFFRSFRRFREFELGRDLRLAMRRETEMLFEHVVRQDRSLAELLDCNYTFLNERLAKYYGIDGVKGDAMRLVSLPPGSPRGGVLTQGTMLTVTSNPDRTSPVKRGLFILENILGTPPPPPPADIPPLEEAAGKISGRPATLRASLALHRQQASCASCHNRMDPLGLALENFNALGRWREKEQGQPIDAAGKLVTGESFQGITELKRILIDRHQREFERCLSEKMLTYALGRGLDSLDVETVDRLVDRLETAGSRPSALLLGIVESIPFQRQRQITSKNVVKSASRSIPGGNTKIRAGADHDHKG